MIKKFHCQGFRNVNCDVELSKINILIGANNAGKSNFIRALTFAANMVSNSPTEATGFFSELKRNGWSSVTNRRVTSPSFKLVWDLDLSDIQPDIQPVKYTLSANVGKRREDDYIKEESLDSAEMRQGYNKPYNYFTCHTEKLGIGNFSTAGIKSTPNKRINTKVDRHESVLLQMDKLFFESKKLFSLPFVRDDIREVLDLMRGYFREFYSYSCTTFNLPAIRDLQDEQAEGAYLKKDASNFVNVFNYISERDNNFKSRYIEALNRLSNQCDDIRINSIGGKTWMEIKMDKIYFPLSELSDGTIHLLLLLLLLNVPKNFGISMLAIDEPEMNLHPAWQKLLAHEIINGESFKQCFISTHSPDFLDEFTKDFLDGKIGVFVFDISSKVPIRKLDLEEIRSELKDWTLGDLYRVGDPLIGGWPQ